MREINKSEMSQNTRKTKKKKKGQTEKQLAKKTAIKLRKT